MFFIYLHVYSKNIFVAHFIYLQMHFVSWSYVYPGLPYSYRKKKLQKRYKKVYLHKILKQFLQTSV